MWIGPLQAAVVILLLMNAIGPSCLAGMAVLLILMPVQTMFGRLFSRLRFVGSKQLKTGVLSHPSSYLSITSKISSLRLKQEM